MESEIKNKTKEELMAYQDGAYDVLNKLPSQLAATGCQTLKDAIRFIELVRKGMEEGSTRGQLGWDNEAQG